MQGLADSPQRLSSSGAMFRDVRGLPPLQPCGKYCGWEGLVAGRVTNQKRMELIRSPENCSKAMFLSWLTLRFVLVTKLLPNQHFRAPS